MIIRRTALLAFLAIPAVVAFLAFGCDMSVKLDYSTRADAEAASPFARGWLPDIIPPSSRNISMRNNLDHNISNGKFDFDPADYGAFVTQLERVSTQDVDGLFAYRYGDWTFWINTEQNHCRFYMELTHNKAPSEKVSTR
jgi:hypothetical protein